MFKSKTKQCQNCKIKFTIEPEDFEFYKKIDVPEPTFCPECRLRRRMAVINERFLYKRKCDLCGEEIFSVYHKDVSFPVYCQKCWYSDKWNSVNYGKNFDFKKSFFEQWLDLKNVVPRFNLTNIKSVNCPYCSKIVNSKNCYLIIGMEAENCLYGNYTRIAKDCIDYYLLIRCESCYESINCTKCNNVHFSQNTVECRDSYFLYDCKNCHDCFGCINLRNKSYHIFNKLYSKKEYKQIISKYNLGSFTGLSVVRDEFYRIKNQFPHRHALILNSIDTTGNNVIGAKNCKSCFDSDTLNFTTENCKNIFMATGISDSYDVLQTGEGAELCYEDAFGFGNHILFSSSIPGESYNIEFSDICFSSSNLFACVGLRHKQYCILNKQYTKESFNKLRTKIIKHMNDMSYTDKKGRIYKYGEFFPPELSPFGYNETIANEYFPLTKEQAIKQGYNWYDKPKSQYQPTIKAKDLPDNIKDVDETILKEVIACENACHSRPASVIPATGVIPAKAGIQRIQKLSGSPIKLGMTEGELGMTEGEIKMTEENTSCAGSGVFRIIPQELKFYKKMNLSLPRLCPNCRHRERIKQRNPLKLWKRQCMKKGCKTTFQTTYSPERPEIIYCESCYNKEVS